MYFSSIFFLSHPSSIYYFSFFSCFTFPISYLGDILLPFLFCSIFCWFACISDGVLPFLNLLALRYQCLSLSLNSVFILLITSTRIMHFIFFPSCLYLCSISLHFSLFCWLRGTISYRSTGIYLLVVHIYYTLVPHILFFF